MKRLLFSLLVIVAFSTGAKAQYVTIPDSNFVKFLKTNYPSCMNGDQMDTTCIGIVNSTEINCSARNISDLSGVQYFDKLKYLYCYSNRLTTLPPLPLSLEWLSCFRNQLLTLPALPSTITYLASHENQLSTVPELPDSIYYLNFNTNRLSSLPALPKALEWFDCSYNQLSTVPILPLGLQKFGCAGNQLVFLPGLPASLITLTCNDNQLASLPTLPDSLSFLKCSNNTALECLPYLKVFGGGKADFMVDGTGIKCLLNIIQHTGSIPAIDTMPICNLFNQNGCNVSRNINGSIFNDTNDDCTSQSTESRLHSIKLNLYQSDSLIQSGYFAGDYGFSTGFSTYRVGVDTTGLPFSLACKQDTTIEITAQDSVRYNIDFALTCKPGFDVGVSNIADRRFRPGMYSSISFNAGDMSAAYGGNCAAGVSGKVTLRIDGPAMLDGGGTSTSWNIADFSASNGYFNELIHIDTGALINDQVCVFINVAPTSGDYNPANNSGSWCYDVRSSWDPNEKEVYPSGSTDTSRKWLTYTVRFQNTGNDTAIHIYVLDTLDANIDVSSFQLLASSHKNVTQIYGNGIVKFNFPNIMLPDSNVNEELSHGYVQYKVKLKDNLSLGTQVFNTAYIYFDFNAPVVTNTTLNTITAEVATGVSPLSFGEGPGVRIYPNPATNQLTISSTGFAAQWITVYDVNGRRVAQQKFTSQMDVSDLTGGVYIVEVRNASGSARKRFVKL